MCNARNGGFTATHQKVLRPLHHIKLSKKIGKRRKKKLPVRFALILDWSPSGWATDMAAFWMLDVSSRLLHTNTQLVIFSYKSTVDIKNIWGVHALITHKHPACHIFWQKYSGHQKYLMCPRTYYTQTPSLSYFLTKVQWTSICFMFPQAYFTLTPSVSYFHRTKIMKKGSVH